MAQLNGFDARNVEPAGDFDAIPAGKYVAVVTESQMKPTKKNDGSYLELTLEVIEGEYKGRQLWARLNLDNPSEEAVRIARGELSSICRAVGVLQPKDSVELHNLPLVVTVKQKKREDTGEVVNEVKGYAKREAGNGTKPLQTSNSTPPWKR